MGASPKGVLKGTTLQRVGVYFPKQLIEPLIPRGAISFQIFTDRKKNDQRDTYVTQRTRMRFDFNEPAGF
jgi:hypothetical protein